MARLRADYVFGTTDAALTSGGTTLSGLALARLPVVAAPDAMALTLYDDTAGTYEIVWVTAHGAAATTATVLRGRESTTAQAWASGAKWSHGATRFDWDTVAPSATMLSAPGVPSAYDDEFDDSPGNSGPRNGLAAKWTRRNLTTGQTVLDASRAPGSLLFDVPTGQAATQLIYQAAPGGDFTVLTRLGWAAASDRQMWGPFIVDTNGTGVSLCLHDPADDGNTYMRTMTTWSGSGATLVQVSTVVNTPWRNSFTPIYLSLRKSGSSYSAAAWMNNERMTANVVGEATTTGLTFTPAYIGVGRHYSNATGSGRQLCDYFRVS